MYHVSSFAFVQAWPRRGIRIIIEVTDAFFSTNKIITFCKPITYESVNRRNSSVLLHSAELMTCCPCGNLLYQLDERGTTVSHRKWNECTVQFADFLAEIYTYVPHANTQKLTALDKTDVYICTYLSSFDNFNFFQNFKLALLGCPYLFLWSKAIRSSVLMA